MATFANTYESKNALSGWMREVQARLQSHRDRSRTYRRTYVELAQLNDRELTDIGISRADIADLARQAADAGH